MKKLAGLLVFLLALRVTAQELPPIKTIFVIVMENHIWADIKGSPDAPFINSVMLQQASHCEDYNSPPGLHPSLPNYLWLEAGTNFGIVDDNDPAADHQNSTNHLAYLLELAGISWRTYQEDISGAYVPLTSTNLYAPRHNPFVYFDDVTGTNNKYYSYGIAHIRPYEELWRDLTNNTVARYNFITPNVCHDMHDSCYPTYNVIRQGDDWLASEVPKILASHAWQDQGALFLCWDESEQSATGPLGMIVLAPSARGDGYFNRIHYTHSSTLRTFQEIFGVTPLLGDAANANNLSDLFTQFGFSAIRWIPGAGVQLTTRGIIPGRTNWLQVSANLASWTTILTNSVNANTFTFLDRAATNATPRFYRLVQRP